MALDADHVVLVVHGVANRNPEQFHADVERLGARLAPCRVQGVFWGDLGPPDAVVAYPDRDAATVLDGVDHSGDEVAAPDVQSALADAEELARDDSVLTSVRGRLRRIVDAVDARLDVLSPEMLIGSFRHAIARTVRDVEAYERNGDVIRSRLDAAFQEVHADVARIDIVAHSLGALVAVEWLLGAPAGRKSVRPKRRGIDTLVTFGSQVSMFCELRGLLGARGSTSNVAPVALELPIRQWCDVWHELDPLAFAMAPTLEVTGRDGKIDIEEYRLELKGVPRQFSFHTTYWNDERFLSWLNRTL